MKDIFSKLKNFLSDPSSTMALIGSLMVFVSSFFVTPDRFCLVLVSFLALFAVITMRVVEMHLTKKIAKRDEIILEKDEQLRRLIQDIDDISAACKKKHEDDLGQLQALDNEYLKLAKQHNAQGEELSKLKKEYDNLLQSLPFEAPVPTTTLKPEKNSTTAASKKAKYSKKDIARIQEEMKAGGMIKEKDEE